MHDSIRKAILDAYSCCNGEAVTQEGPWHNAQKFDTEVGMQQVSHASYSPDARALYHGSASIVHTIRTGQS